MRLEMNTADYPVWIEDVGEHLCIDDGEACLISLTKSQAEQLVDILTVWVKGSEQ